MVPRDVTTIPTFGAEYSYGRQEDPRTGEKSTTIDHAMALAKYDHFFTKKFYGYLGTKAERDKVAALELRLAPGAGRRLSAQHRRGGSPGGVEGALRRAALRAPLRRGRYSGNPSTAYIPRVRGLGLPHWPNQRR